MKPTIPIFGIAWHGRNLPSQDELVHDPLRPYIRFEPYEWDGEHLPAMQGRKTSAGPMVFFFLPPPPEILSNPHARVIWIPMWDAARGLTPEWWQALPKNVRVVAFSNQARIRAQSTGLTTLFLKKYYRPEDFPRADWSGGRVLYYWNRNALVSPSFLRRLCETLQVDVLLFRRSLNPAIPPHWDYPLPEKLGRTEVCEFSENNIVSREDYWKTLSRANIVLSPRASEGVGLTFLEALARGCAVLAYNGPTMNEYIQQKTNGYLFESYHATWMNLLRFRFEDRLTRAQASGTGRTYRPDRQISQWQDWTDIGRMNLRGLGEAARNDQAAGFQSWIRSLPEYADFILDW